MLTKTRRAEIIIPLLLLLIGIAWMFIASYLTNTNPAISSFLTSSDNYRDGFALVLVAVATYFLLKKHAQKDKQYQTLFDNSPVPMWIFDRSTLRFLHVNQAAITHYGYTREEFLLMTIKDIRPSFEHERLKKHIADIQANHENKDNWVHVKKNGEHITVTVTSCNVEFKGEVCRLSVASDITEMLNAHETRKKAEMAAREKSALVEEQNRRLQEIAFKASHVMRAPLTNILGLVNLMNDPGITMEEKERLLPQLKEAGDSLDLVIREVVTETFNSQQIARNWVEAHKAVLLARRKVNETTGKQ